MKNTSTFNQWEFLNGPDIIWSCEQNKIHLQYVQVILLMIEYFWHLHKSCTSPFQLFWGTYDRIQFCGVSQLFKREFNFFFAILFCYTFGNGVRQCDEGTKSWSLLFEVSASVLHLKCKCMWKCKWKWKCRRQEIEKWFFPLN